MSTTASARTVATPAEVQDNQNYVNHLIGTDRLLTPAETTLGQRLIAELDRGVPKGQVVMELLSSQPSRAVHVRASYEALLGRAPSTKELNAGVALLQRAGDDRAMEISLIGSSEFYKKRGGGTAVGFLDALYQDVVQRSPTAKELSAGLKVLAGRGSRTAMVRQLLKEPEAQAILIQAAYATSGTVASAPSSQDYKDLASPNGLLKITARGLAADNAFQQIAYPAATTPAASTSSASNQPPGYPIAAGFNLNSSFQPLALSSTYLQGNFGTMSAGDDDVLWISGQRTLSTYDLDTGSLTQVYSLGEMTGTISSVSAIDATEAYAALGETGNIVHVQVTSGVGTGTFLPALPSGDIVTQVSASSDGVVWALGQSGNLYSYSSGSNTWATISTDGVALAQISVGSATNIWALTAGGEPLQYNATEGFDFQAYSVFGNTTVTSVQATADGAVWASASNNLYLKPAGGTWAPAPAAAQPTVLKYVAGLGNLSFAAGSMNRAYVLGSTSSSDPLLNLQIDLSNVGVVDRQAVPFPAYTTGAELEAYQALSLAATMQTNSDIRSLYDEMGEDFSGYAGALRSYATPPPTFSDPAAWTAVYTELESELMDLGDVNARFDNIIQTNNTIMAINNGQLNAVGQIAGLIVNGISSGKGIDVILTDLFEGVLGALSSTGISAGYATLASILSSGIDDVIASFQTAHMANPGQAVSIEFSQLQTQLDKIFLASISTIDSDLESISTDSGKLAAVADEITSNNWPLPDSLNFTPLIQAYDAYFYQSLIASGWQVEHSLYGDYNQYPISQILSGVPVYDYAQYPDGYEDGLEVENVYLINQLGSTTDWNSPDIQVGPFPSSALIAGIQGLGDAATDDFWTGQGGWSVIKRLEAKLS